MLAVDLVAGAVIAGAVAWGLTQGLRGTPALAAFAVGAVLGTRAPLLVGSDLRSPGALLVALPAALVLGGLLAALAEQLGARRGRGRRARATRGGAWASAAAGGLLAGSLGVVAVWILGPVATEVGSLRDPVERSEVLGRLNSVLEPAGPAPVRKPLPIDRLPMFAVGPPDVPAPDPRVETDPDVRGAVGGIVRIGVGGCGGDGLGSGWIATDGIVVTNAHVVSMARSIAVRLRGTGPRRAATPIWFDRRNDLALLRVPGLAGVPALAMVRRPASGTSGASLGFPAGRRRIRRARLGPTSSTLEGRIGGSPRGFPRSVFGRLVTTFRGQIRPGNSGGPVVDERGRVLTTASAGSTTGTGGLGVPNRLVRTALGRAGPRVGTGRCPERV